MSWIRPVLFGMAATMLYAFVLFTTPGTGSSAWAQAPATGASGIYSGVITDSVCGARHTKYPNLDAVKCTRECVRTGAKYMLIDGDKSYALQGDFAELAQFAGQRARVTGTLQGDTIHITAINSPQQ
jgi:hypothetical protein